MTEDQPIISITEGDWVDILSRPLRPDAAPPGRRQDWLYTLGLRIRPRHREDWLSGQVESVGLYGSEPAFRMHTGQVILLEEIALCINRTRDTGTYQTPDL